MREEVRFSSRRVVDRIAPPAHDDARRALDTVDNRAPIVIDALSIDAHARG
jgi:hypothetical protein